MKTLRQLAILTLTLALVVGCSRGQVLTTLGLGAAAGAGAAAVYYTKGDLEADIKDDVKTVYKATLDAFERRDYKVEEKDSSDQDALVKAEIPGEGDKKDRNVTVKITRKDKNESHISIRIGVFGDESRSQKILDDIVAELPRK